MKNNKGTESITSAEQSARVGALPVPDPPPRTFVDATDGPHPEGRWRLRVDGLRRNVDPKLFARMHVALMTALAAVEEATEGRSHFVELVQVPDREA
jgi:hypothetical protein